jgi:hypothetical protein
MTEPEEIGNDGSRDGQPKRCVRLRLTSCMPCHPHQFTRPSAALLGTASVVLRRHAEQGAVVRREAACGIAADNLLTGQEASAVVRLTYAGEPVQTPCFAAGALRLSGQVQPIVDVRELGRGGRC